MDDFKENNGLEPEVQDDNFSDTPAVPETPESNEPAEEIQTEENTATAEEDEGGIPITEPECDSDSDEPEMCILCGEKPADKSFGENYDLCADCRQSLIKSPLRFKGFVALIAILVLGVWGMMFLGSQLTTLEAVEQGYTYLEQNKPESALESIASQSNIGWKTASKVAELCYEMGSVDDVSYLVDMFFYDKTNVEEGEVLTWADKVGKSDINAPWNKKIKKTYAFVTEVSDYANKHSELFYKYYEQLYYGEITEKEIPYDELIKQYSDKLAAAENNHEKGIINYYMLALSSICEKDAETQLKYCSAVAENAPECTWLYQDNLITLYIQTGDYTKADERIAKLREKNPESLYADRYEAISLRYQGKYDEAMEGFKAILEGEALNDAYYDVYYDALVCEFLAGNYEEAYEYASACFNDQYYLTPESVNFYALLSKKLGKDSGYNAVVEFLKGYDMKISPSVDKFISGEITTEQLIQNGEVVFE